jgi:hypothetical protein
VVGVVLVTFGGWCFNPNPLWQTVLIILHLVVTWSGRFSSY